MGKNIDKMDEFEKIWNSFVDYNCPSLKGSDQLHDMQVMFFLGASSFNKILHRFVADNDLDGLNQICSMIDIFLEKQGIKVEKHDIEDHGKKH